MFFHGTIPCIKIGVSNTLVIIMEGIIMATKSNSIKSTVTLQLNGKDYDFNKITKDSVSAAQKIKKDVKAVNVYVNAADSAAYYTVDGAGSADYKIVLN